MISVWTIFTKYVIRNEALNIIKNKTPVVLRDFETIDWLKQFGLKFIGLSYPRDIYKKKKFPEFNTFRRICLPK